VNSVFGTIENRTPCEGMVSVLPIDMVSMSTLALARLPRVQGFFVGLVSRPHFIGTDPPSPLHLPASFMLAGGHSADNVYVACWQTGK
jgi:hypothetical protein